MISLTRLNGSRFVLNAELIRVVEQNPDTVITLVGGEHLVVRESMREVVARSIEYRRHTRTLTPGAELRETLNQDLPGPENLHTPPHKRHA
ncbi:MAG: flagellar FlbD family protein [Phycisphaerales bacterium JB059]